jgi:hypothetical protein
VEHQIPESSAVSAENLHRFRQIAGLVNVEP